MRRSAAVGIRAVDSGMSSTLLKNTAEMTAVAKYEIEDAAAAPHSSYAGMSVKYRARVIAATIAAV